MIDWPGVPRRCSLTAWSTKWLRCLTVGCVTASPHRGRWAMRRFWLTSTPAVTATLHVNRPSSAPAATCGASGRGFDVTTGSSGWMPARPTMRTRRCGPGGTYPERVMFAKGHGTQNDFVLLPDPDAKLTLTPAVVSALCDRRRGLGADGVLRVTTAGAALAVGVLDRVPDGGRADDQ